MMIRWTTRSTEMLAPSDPNSDGSPMIPVISVEKVLQFRATLTDEWKDVPVEPENPNDT